MRRRETLQLTRMKFRVVTGVAIVLVLGLAGVCVECKVKVHSTLLAKLTWSKVA